jgi:WD40 repeat protein
MRLWDLRTGRELAQFVGHTGNVGPVAFTPDGRRALSASADRTVRTWELDTRKELGCFEMQRLESVMTFSPDRKLAITSNGLHNVLRLRDVESGEERNRFSGTCLAVSADASRAVCGIRDGVVEVWELSRE